MVGATGAAGAALTVQNLTGANTGSATNWISGSQQGGILITNNTASNGVLGEPLHAALGTTINWIV